MWRVFPRLRCCDIKVSPLREHGVFLLGLGCVGEHVVGRAGAWEFEFCKSDFAWGELSWMLGMEVADGDVVLVSSGSELRLSSAG